MMKIYRAVVVSVIRLSPGMLRITFGGHDLPHFDTTGVGDEYLRVFLPRDGEQEPVLPFGTETSWDYPDGVEAGPLRTYTVRNVSAENGTIDIDFVVHDGGIAAAWAQRAKPGDVVGLNSPTGLYDPPAGLDWQILLADATGLPAAARLIEQAPPGVRTRAVLEVLGPEHRQTIDAAGTDVTWIYGGNGHSQSQLEQIIRGIELPPGRGYIWFAGETATMRAVRKYLRHEKKLPNASYKAIGYWTDKAELWQERWDGLDADIKKQLMSLWDDEGRDEEDITDEYIQKLELLGL